jgi:hypothetical protein
MCMERSMQRTLHRLRTKTRIRVQDSNNHTWPIFQKGTHSVISVL